MATKKATYRYDNGSSWDEIMFKTTADQVVLNNGETVQNFFDKGGIIGGNYGSSNKTALLDNITNGGAIGLRCKTGDGYSRAVFLAAPPTSSTKHSFRPDTYSSGAVDLGSSDVLFGDLYLNGFNRASNGYTKLPNGLILQWGKVNVYFGGGNNSYIYGLLPIAFSTIILSHQGICSGNSFTWGNSDLIVGVGSVDNRGVTWTVNTRNDASVTGNVEISYMVLGY